MFCEVFRKQRDRQLLSVLEHQIAAVINDHPEYHQILINKEQALNHEFTPEQGKTNPFLHMGMHLAIREQVATDRPAGIRAIHQRLSMKIGASEAEHHMMDCLGGALWLAQRNNQPPDEAAYLECIRKIV
jgi:hypothetical protein